MPGNKMSYGGSSYVCVNPVYQTMQIQSLLAGMTAYAKDTSNTAYFDQMTLDDINVSFQFYNTTRGNRAAPWGSIVDYRARLKMLSTIAYEAGGNYVDETGTLTLTWLQVAYYLINYSARDPAAALLEADSADLVTNSTMWLLAAGKGADGKSAYQQALDAGYTGTEAAFYAALTNIETAKTTADGAVTRLNSVDKSISTLKEITSTHNSNISKINNDASYANKVIKLDCEALLSNALTSVSHAYLKNNVLYLSVRIRGADAMPAFTNLFKIRIGGTGLSTASLLTYIYTTVMFYKNPDYGVMPSAIRIDYAIVNDNLVLTFVGGADGIGLPARSSQHIETAFLLPKAVYTEPSVEDIDGDVNVDPF